MIVLGIKYLIRALFGERGNAGVLVVLFEGYLMRMIGVVEWV